MSIKRIRILKGLTDFILYIIHCVFELFYGILLAVLKPLKYLTFKTLLKAVVLFSGFLFFVILLCIALKNFLPEIWQIFMCYLDTLSN